MTCEIAAIEERLEKLENRLRATATSVRELGEIFLNDEKATDKRVAALEQRVLIIDAFIEESGDIRPIRAPILVPGVHPTVEDRKDARSGAWILVVAVLFSALCGGLGVWWGL